MPRPTEGGWGDFRFPRRAEPLPELDRPRYCTCRPWPCDPETCGDCPACQRHGRPLFTRAELRWIATDEGLPKETVEELRRLSQPHGPTSRRKRTDAKGEVA